jgi:phage tail protein X
LLKTYTTAAGDVWDKIAFEKLGNEKYTDNLIKANPAYEDTTIFSAGVVLTLPEIEKTKASSVPPWKR